VVWEVLKRKGHAPGPKQQQATSPLKALVKLGKLAYLVFILVQTLFLDLLPIADDPTVLRIVGTTLYFVGLATAIVGRVQLGNNWMDIEEGQVLHKQSLVTGGIYRYIRHPIYIGDVLMLTGLELALNSWLVLTVLIPLVVGVKQALAEEALLSRVFPDYEAYRKRTKRFIPFVV
jgi:protein-S-isoprenylcysteine O-methyltransferase Ste14